MTGLATNLDEQSAASGGTSPDAETLRKRLRRWGYRP